MTSFERTPAPTAVAYSLAACFFGHQIVTSTVSQDASSHGQVRAVLERSYMGPTPQGFGDAAQTTTTLPPSLADGSIVISPGRSEDRVVREVRLLQDLGEGWDGEYGQPPRPDAVNDAVRFLRLAGSRAARLEATLHPDGSVVLEIEDGSEGSFRFKGDGFVICTAEGIRPQTMTLKGRGFLAEFESALTA